MIKVMYRRPQTGWMITQPDVRVAEIAAQWLRRSRG